MVAKGRPQKLTNWLMCKGGPIYKEAVALLTLNTLLALSIVLPLPATSTARYDELMCEEVAEVVNESVTYGTLTQAEADDISDSCYQLYS